MDPVRGTLRSDTARLSPDTFRDWPAQIGLPLPVFVQDTTGPARVRAHSSRARDVAVMDFRTTTAVRAVGPTSGRGELRLHLVRAGSWTFRQDRSATPVEAGRFLLGRSTGARGFDLTAHTAARTVALPPGALPPPAGDRPVTGSATAPEVRLLMAQASLLHDTIHDLTDAGVGTARTVLIELFRGVLHSHVDALEPAVAPALARAARELADRRLADPDLTPTRLAGELHVSLRTLQRAFTAGGEPVTAYIRRRRLEEAAHALRTPAPLSVSELAARFHFADSSHFIRAFRRHFGRTPAHYAREPH